MPVINGPDRNQISFSSLKDEIAADSEVPFIDAFLNTKKAVGCLPCYTDY